MTDFTMTTDAEGVAIITWDVASKSMNVMSTEAFMDLSAKVDQALADPAAKGIIITSGKKDFAGGMDLNVIAAMRAGGARAIFDGVMGMHHVLRKIELAGMDMKTKKGGKPIVAALPGTAGAACGLFAIAAGCQPERECACGKQHEHAMQPPRRCGARIGRRITETRGGT